MIVTWTMAFFVNPDHWDNKAFIIIYNIIKCVVCMSVSPTVNTLASMCCTNWFAVLQSNQNPLPHSDCYQSQSNIVMRIESFVGSCYYYISFIAQLNHYPSDWWGPWLYELRLNLLRCQTDWYSSWWRSTCCR